MRIFSAVSLLFASTTAIFLEDQDQDQASARPRLFSSLDLNQNGIPDLQEAREKAARLAVEAQADLDETIIAA